MVKSREDNCERSKRFVPLVDGGWGWVVVVGSFFIHVFADGIVYSFGMLFDVIMKEFDASNAEAATILALLTGLTLSVGPIASAVTNKFGCRICAMTGSLIAAAGCALSHYATSVQYLMVTVGCIMGLGFGLMYCPAIVIVTMYFEKKRALATGMAVCGAGVGTVIFAPISETLLRLFSWRHVFIAYAGVVLLCLGCGAVFRPLKFIQVEDDNTKETGSDAKHSDDNTEKSEEAEQHLKQEERENEELLDGPSKSQENIDGGERSSEPHSYGSVSPRRRTISESTGFITVKDVFLAGSVSAVQDFEEHRDQYRSLTSIEEPHNATSQQTTLLAREDISEANRARGIWSTIVKMTDLSLLLDPIFLLFAVSNLLTSVAFNSPLLFLPVHAERLGCSPKQAAQIISVFGMMNTLGRIAIGLISDRELPTKYGKDTARNRLCIYILSLSICGILTMLVFLCTDFATLIVYSGLFGLTLSSYVCLTSVVLVDLLGLERLTNAFGLLLLFQGIGTVFGPPIAGKLADVTGSYNWSFVFCGVSLLVSGAMLFAIPPIQAKRSRTNYDLETATRQRSVSPTAIPY